MMKILFKKDLNKQAAWRLLAKHMVSVKGQKPILWMGLSLDPVKFTKWCKPGELFRDDTLEDKLIDILRPHLRIIAQRTEIHYRFTASVGQSESGAFGFHIVGFVPDEEVDKFKLDVVKKINNWWRKKRGEAFEEDFMPGGGGLGYSLDHHQLLIIDEAFCSRRKSGCRKSEDRCRFKIRVI